MGITFTGSPISLSNEPTIVSYGFPELNEIQDLSEKTSQLVHFALENDSDSVLDWYNIRENITRLVANML